MKIILPIAISLLLITGCGDSVEQQPQIENYLRWVGDIEHDPVLDNSSFELCNGEKKVMQYFNNARGFEYKGEKFAILKIFEDRYIPPASKSEHGLLRVRFIVNCEGKTGRFRCLGMDNNYKRKQFDSGIQDQILTITKSLDGWVPKTMNGELLDYYQYLIFKIEAGQIKEILP